MESRYLLERRAHMLKGTSIKDVADAKKSNDKKKKGIPKRSKEKKKEMPELIRLYEIFLKKHPLCEINGPKCTVKATAAHHSEGRIGKNLMDTTKWVPSCEPCNLWCETNPKEAKKKGVSKSRLK